MTTTSGAVRLQLEPGLWGVTKVVWRSWPRRTAVSWVVAGMFLAGAGGAVLALADPGPSRTVAWWATGVLVAGVVARLLHEARTSPDAGPPPWDRQLVDPWWTSIHTGTGTVLGLWAVPWWLVVALTVGWELLEIVVPGFGDEEINGNRATDIAVAVLGWLVVTLLTGWLLGTARV